MAYNGAGRAVDAAEWPGRGPGVGDGCCSERCCRIVKTWCCP